jgi:hypothetical protein
VVLHEARFKNTAIALAIAVVGWVIVQASYHADSPRLCSANRPPVRQSGLREIAVAAGVLLRRDAAAPTR